MLGRLLFAVVLSVCSMLILSFSSSRELLANDQFGIGPLRSTARAFGDNRQAVRSLRVIADEARNDAVDRLQGQPQRFSQPQRQCLHADRSQRILLVDSSQFAPSQAIIIRQSSSGLQSQSIRVDQRSSGSQTRIRIESR